MKHSNVRIFVLSLVTVCILSSFNIKNTDIKEDVPFLRKTSFEHYYAYSLPIQSQIFFINGCFYRVRAVLTFEWDGIPGHAPTSASITNVQLIQECTSTQTTFYTRTSEFVYNNASRETSVLTFESLENSTLDAALSNTDLINDLKANITDSINSVTDN
ncbi:MAG: hypothetical protein H7Y86_01225 [Rhizobacter sp.]|nr:hypothetical protein [Ferruginibacter sp.]